MWFILYSICLQKLYVQGFSSFANFSMIVLNIVDDTHRRASKILRSYLFLLNMKTKRAAKKKCKRKKTIKKFLLQQIVIIVMCVAFTSVHSTSTNVMKLSLHFICDTIPVSIYMIEWILWMLSGPQHWRQSAKVRYLSVLLTYKRKRYTYIKYRRQASE